VCISYRRCYIVIVSYNKVFHIKTHQLLSYMAHAKEGELLPHHRFIRAVLYFCSPKQQVLSRVRLHRLASISILDVLINGAPGKNRTHTPGLQNRTSAIKDTRAILERVTRIELVSLAWKAKVLPLHNTRNKRLSLQTVMFRRLIHQTFILHFDGLISSSHTIHKFISGWSVDLNDTT
jgi:hypothetical protein